MKTVLRLAFIGVLSFGLLFAQDARLDPQGWSKVRWGMTLPQVQSVIPVGPQRDRGAYGASYQLQPVNIFDIPMACVVKVDSTEVVTAVSMFSSFGGKGDPIGNGRIEHEIISDKLREKYGAPTEKTTERRTSGIVTRTVWIFPTTSIVLQYDAYPRIATGVVSIMYKSIGKKSDIL